MQASGRHPANRPLSGVEVPHTDMSIAASHNT